MNFVADACDTTAVDIDPHDLVHRIGDGDEGALAELYARFAGPVYGFVLRRVSDREVVEEVCADVWLGCWRSARSFRGDSQVLTWLLGIASRQVFTHTRRKRPTKVPLADVGEGPDRSSRDPADAVVSHASFDAMIGVIERLPTDLYEVITLAWLHELPYREISDIVGCPVGTVKSRVSRARRLLQHKIGPHHG